jgi:hypothetical protein
VGLLVLGRGCLRAFSRLLERQLRYVFQTRDQTLHTKRKGRPLAFLGAIDHCFYDLRAMLEQKFLQPNFSYSGFPEDAHGQTYYPARTVDLSRSSRTLLEIHLLTTFFGDMSESKIRRLMVKPHPAESPEIRTSCKHQIFLRIQISNRASRIGFGC